ncbi:hypothetical protein MUN82_00900 [Hymenobacter aerilatus]|uniref:Uncharacterized protein n=1 Tax=Hymenobacter aerilatus TaxID=2932251 RepID=A0A8T9SU27_9BACT|nr:hypothetical protein [Hymenobacter aerilatus]UOR05672.1 hypothetical protein MUN82_00900 [Hymenobacter aerilatus]
MPPTSTRIRLQPANNSRIPFWGQMAIGLLWIFYVGSRLVTDSNSTDQHFLDYVFLVFSLIYIGYVLVNNAPIFGTQTYLEFTPAYMVHKGGLFQPKQAFPAEDISSLELALRQLRVKLRDGNSYVLSLREVRGSRRRRILHEQVQRFAANHQIPLRDSQEK